MNGKQVQTQPGRQSRKQRQQNYSCWDSSGGPGIKALRCFLCSSIPGQGAKVPHAQSNNSSKKQLRAAAISHHLIPHWKQTQISQACLEPSKPVKGAEWCVYVCR